MRRPFLIVLLSAIAIGCASQAQVPSSPDIERPAPKRTLESLVGQRVTLSGRFSGPGKLTDYVVTEYGSVYLFSKFNTLPPGPPAYVEFEKGPAYGTRITVSGVLGYSPPYKPMDRSTKKSELPIAGIPEFYYIASPQLQVEK